MMKRLLILFLTVVFACCLGACDLTEPAELVRWLLPTEAVYDDMRLSGEGTEIGYHEDDYGFVILNRPEYVHPDGYTPLHTPYSYEALTQTWQRELYDSLYDAFYCLSDEESELYDGYYQLRPVRLTDAVYTMLEVETVMIAVLDDHPELFWVAQDFYLSADPDAGVTELTFYTSYKSEEIIRMMTELNRCLREFYAAVPVSLSPYEREVYVYGWLIDNCVYDEHVDDSQEYSDTHPSIYNLYGVLADHSAVCEGYARAFDYLCGELGVDAVCIGGTTDSDRDAPHSWNAVRLNDNWYLADPTWDDWDTEEDEGVVYTYLNLDEELMDLDHTPFPTYGELSESDYDELTYTVNSFVPSPCDSTEYSYILRESVILSDMDIDALADGMVRAASAHREALMVYADPSVYTLDEAAELLFADDQPYYEALDRANGRLSDVQLDAYGDVVYYDYEDRSLLVFELTYE